MSALDDLASRAKKLPWKTIALVGGGVIVVFIAVRSMSGGGSSGGGELVSGGMSEGAQVQLALAGMQMTGAQNQVQAQLAMQSADIQGQLAIMALSAQTQLALDAQRGDREFDLAQMQIIAGAAQQSQMLEFYNAQDQRQFELTRQNQQLSLDMANIQAQSYETMLLSHERQTIHAQQTWADTTMFQTAITGQTQQFMAQMQRDVSLDQGATQRYIAKQQAKSSMFGSLFGFLGGLF